MRYAFPRTFQATGDGPGDQTMNRHRIIVLVAVCSLGLACMPPVPTAPAPAPATAAGFVAPPNPNGLALKVVNLTDVDIEGQIWIGNVSRLRYIGNGLEVVLIASCADRLGFGGLNERLTLFNSDGTRDTVDGMDLSRGIHYECGDVVVIFLTIEGNSLLLDAFRL